MIHGRATVSEIIGLLEILKDYKGDEDLAKIADDFDLEIDEILPSVEAAHLLGFIEIKEGNLKLTDAGKAILEASISERKDIFRSQLLKDIFFKELMDTIVRHEGRMSKKDAYEFIESKLKTKDKKEYFNMLVGWGRYAGLIGYNHDEEYIYIDT